jgi:hypothetical protein
MTSVVADAVLEGKKASLEDESNTKEENVKVAV